LGPVVSHTYYGSEVLEKYHPFFTVALYFADEGTRFRAKCPNHLTDIVVLIAWSTE
jgi:hypothetical protein